MTEQKVKNRGWVKNVAIIFLAVMLVLTFFSNTIMNASLPEAAVQYVQSGAITTQIRGTGTIEAKETYEVKTTTSRKIQSVLVTRGQEVKVGDVLVLLAAGEGVPQGDGGPRRRGSGRGVEAAERGRQRAGLLVDVQAVAVALEELA